MTYVQVDNVKQASGFFDYKGLDLNLIVPGTQHYPQASNSAFFGYEGVIPEHPDLHSITEEHYETVKADELKPEPSVYEQLDELKKKYVVLEQAQADLLSTLAEKKVL